jgi:hypothetical protein
MNRGQLIAVNGEIYEYDKYDKCLDVHFCTEIEIDEYGNLTMTYVPCYFNTEELENDTLNLTEKQWLGMVETLIRSAYTLEDNESVETAAEDIVYRCFTLTGIPKMHELEDYIAEYMDR